MSTDNIQPEDDYTETVELPMTERDQADLADMLAEPDNFTYHTVLQVWLEILKQENLELNRAITPRWATNIVSKYDEVRFADMPAYVEEYFDLVTACRDAIQAEVDKHEDCLIYNDAAEDALENAEIYKEILRNWQLEFLRRELTWNCEDERAAVKIAALSEVHGVFFGDTGLSAHLEVIKMEFTDEDQADLQAALDELRLELTGGGERE